MRLVSTRVAIRKRNCSPAESFTPLHLRNCEVGMRLKCVASLLVGLLLSGQCSAATQPYKIDKNHSTVGFSIMIMNGLSRVTGKFTDFDIKLQIDDKHL